MKSIDYLKSHGVNIDKSLELFGDVETYNSTLGNFIVSASEKVNKLNNCKEKKDLQNFAIYVHSLKSDAKYFGFDKLSSLAFEMEKKSKEGDMYFINEKFDELIEETKKSIKLVRDYLDNSTEDNEEKTNKESSLEYNSKTFLVVDDSNIIRNFVKKIYDGEYFVGTATDGQEAIDIIEANKNNNLIEAILLDLNMPKVDGFQVLDYMKKNNMFDKMPVSIISGDSSKETIDKAFNYPIVDMLEKPFNNQDIKNVLEKTRLLNNCD